MKVLFMTREYPPHVYGGAGVHVEYLTRELAHRIEVEIRCFGDQVDTYGNPAVVGYPLGGRIFEGNPFPVKQTFKVLDTCLHFNAAPVTADLVHCHTWYAMFGGILAKIGYGVPLVATVHSLEPLRPWKREQLGRGYDLSSWVERNALEMADGIIAVSQRDAREILDRFAVDPERLRVIPNGIDCHFFRPVDSTVELARYDIDPARPYVLFLGRVSRQKGIIHFLKAAAGFEPETQIVICASAPDSAEIAHEVEKSLYELRQRRSVVWINEMVSKKTAVELYTHAAVFCCPSIYEPFGIINLEAMACETPVVASRVGGIPDVVVDGETGLLIDFEPRSPIDPEPADPGQFAAHITAAVNRLLKDETLRRTMGAKGRQRAAEKFGWDKVAGKTLEFYREIMEKTARGKG